MAALRRCCARRWPKLNWILSPAAGGGAEYHWQIVVGGGIAAALILYWFSRLTHFKTAEERLREAIVRGKQENPEDKEVSISLASMIK